MLERLLLLLIPESLRLQTDGLILRISSGETLSAQVACTLFGILFCMWFDDVFKAVCSACKGTVALDALSIEVTFKQIKAIKFTSFKTRIL